VCVREREVGQQAAYLRLGLGEIEGRESYEETYKHTELTIKIPSKAR
jgi:hypothetical protein